MIPAHHASAALASNPGAEVALLDGTGHLPQLTRAGLVAERLSSFINDSPVRAPVWPITASPVRALLPSRQGRPCALAEASI